MAAVVFSDRRARSVNGTENHFASRFHANSLIALANRSSRGLQIRSRAIRSPYAQFLASTRRCRVITGIEKRQKISRYHSHVSGVQLADRPYANASEEGNARDDGCERERGKVVRERSNLRKKWPRGYIRDARPNRGYFLEAKKAVYLHCRWE